MKFYRSGCTREEYIGDTVDVVCCNHYKVYEYISGEKCVTTYDNHLSIDGVERQIERYYHRGYDTCFVENENGKTVDRIVINYKKYDKWAKDNPELAQRILQLHEEVTKDIPAY